MAISKKLLATASLAVCAACGGSNAKTYSLTGTATVTGTVAGQSLTATDAVSNVVAIGSSSAGAILITTATAQCNLINAHQQLKNGKALAIEVGTQTGTAVAPPVVGTYNIFNSAAVGTQQGKVGVVQFVVTNATCNGSPIDAQSGTVTLTRVDDTGYTGTFDLTFSTTTDHISGNFNSGTCSALGGSTSSTCPP